MRVFVLDKNRKPLDPCHPAKARILLKEGRACSGAAAQEQGFSESIHLLSEGARFGGRKLCNSLPPTKDRSRRQNNRFGDNPKSSGCLGG